VTLVEFRRQSARFEFHLQGISLPLVKIFSRNLVGMLTMGSNVWNGPNMGIYQNGSFKLRKLKNIMLFYLGMLTSLDRDESRLRRVSKKFSGSRKIFLLEKYSPQNFKFIFLCDKK